MLKSQSKAHQKLESSKFDFSKDFEGGETEKSAVEKGDVEKDVPGPTAGETPDVAETASGQKTEIEQLIENLTEQRLKDTRNNFRSQMRLQQEPVKYFKDVIGYLRAVAEDQEAFFKDRETIEDFFFSDWLESIVKTLATLVKTQLNKEEFKNLLGEVPPLLAKILYKNLDSKETHMALSSMFDVKSKLFQNHYLSDENSIITRSQGIKDTLSQEERAWRESLEQGYQIEAIKIDPGLKCKCWQTATIQSIENQKVKIKFNGESKTCDREIELWGPELAPCGQRSKEDDQFRASIAVGQQIDCFDVTGFWYQALILQKEIRQFQGEQIEHIEVAFRVYDANGEKKDKQGNKYYGYEEEFDEWVPLMSARLAPHHKFTTDSIENLTMATQNANPVTKNSKSDESSKSPLIDDSLDKLVDNTDGKRIYAVQRKQCRSDLLIDFINTFGNQGGFDKLMERIQDFSEDANGSDELNYIGAVVDNISKCMPVLHAGVANEFFEKIEKAAIDKIMKGTNRQMRNTSKETTDDILEKLYKEILPRLPHREVIDLNCERQKVLLEIGVLFLSQDFLSRRVDGVKLINEVCSHCLRSLQQPQTSTTSSSQTQAINFEKKLKMVDDLVERLLKDGEVLKSIFSKDQTHLQLVQRTENLIRLLMVKGKLSQEYREFVWQACFINDCEMKLDIYKVLIGAAQDMQKEDRLFFIDKMLQIPLNEIIDREVELVTNLSSALRGRTDCEDIQQRGLQFIWNISMGSNEKVPIQVVNRAQMGLSDILKSLPIDQKIDYADKLAEKAKDLHQGFLVVKILSKFLKQGFEGQIDHSEVKNLSSLIDHLEKKHQLYNSIFQNLIDYMAKVTELIQKGEFEVNDELKIKVIYGKYAHCDQLTERLEFIKFYAENSENVSINSEQLNILWEQLAIKSPLDSDKNFIYQWLREVCDTFLREREKKGIQDAHKDSSIVTLDNLMAFYKDKMLRDDEEEVYKDLTVEGFHCIQSFFVLLNGITGKIIRITESYGQYKGKHLIPKPEVTTTTTNQQTSSDPELDWTKPAKATSIEYNAKTGQMTSYSNTGGASYSAYSWSGVENEAKNTAVSTATGPVYGPYQGPYQKSPVDGWKYAAVSWDNAKKDEEIDPDDLTIEVLVPPDQLEGYKILWRVATETKGKKTIDAAARLLVQMHHNVHSSLEHRIVEFDDKFIKQCIEIANKQKPTINSRTKEQWDEIQKKINNLPESANTMMQLAARPVQERRIIRSLFLLKQLIRASEKNGTYDLRPHESMSTKSTQLTSLTLHNNITKGDQYRPKIQLSISNQATVWDLKKRIGVEIASFSLDGGQTYALHPQPDGTPTPPVHPAAIKLYQMAESKDIKDPFNGVTLKDMNIKKNEHFGVFRKGAYLTRRGPIILDNEETGKPELTRAADAAITEVFERFSEISEKTGGKRMMTHELCVVFVHVVTMVKSSMEDPRVHDLLNKYSVDKDAKEKLIDLAGMKEFCINSCIIGKEDQLRTNFRLLGYGQDLRKLPQDGQSESILQLRKCKEDMPRYKIACNDHYFDSIINLLQYDICVANRASEIIATLTTRPLLYSVVSQLKFSGTSESKKAEESNQKFDWSSIFDSDNVNKMLYSLEIVTAILAGYTDCDKTKQEITDSLVKWVSRFIDLQGLQELQKQLTSALKKVHNTSSQKKSNEKKLVDQLLQLIRMFLITATASQNPNKIPDTADTTTKEEQPASQDPPQVVTSTSADVEIKVDVSDTPKTPKKKTQQDTAMTFDATGNYDDLTVQDLFGDNAAGAETTTQVEKKVNEDKEKEEKDDSLQYLSEVLRRDGLGKRVLEIIDGQQILKQVSELIESVMDADLVNLKEDKLLIESSLNLWSQLAKGESAKGNKPDIDAKFVLKGLIEIKNLNVRESFCNNYREIAIECEQFAQQLFEILFDQLKTLQDLRKYMTGKDKRTTEFFSLICSLIPIVGKEKPDQLHQLLRVSINSSLSHYSTEQKGEHDVDSTRIGLFKIISVTLDFFIKDAENLNKGLQIISELKLIDHVHKDCLFYYGTQNDEDQNEGSLTIQKQVTEAKAQTMRCYTTDSRKAAYELLNQYQKCLNPEEMGDYLYNYIIPLIKDVQRPKKWKHQPSSLGRVNGHCGLVNLGCICYMISMLQQFFLVPQFRYQLLKAEDDQPENLMEWREEMIDDNMLKQLRRLFGYLELSARHAYNPKPFCFAFKEFDGTPTKISEQKDSQEFLNIFFDRLEHQLKPTTQKYLVRDVFAGNMCTQLICSSCGKVKNRIELFNNLSLQVKGSSGIYDSLSQLSRGQTIEDYNCDICNKRTNVLRRQLIADTPNTLIVHLQRIVFSFETFQNDKVNDHFEFPQILNLKDYSFKERISKEGISLENMKAEDGVDLSKLNEIDDDEYIYRLVGVNIHVGTADRGHYYSLINLNRGSTEPDPFATDDQGNSKYQDWTQVAKNSWKRFDDSVVGDFDFDKNLKSESFGTTPVAGQVQTRNGNVMTDGDYAAFLAGGGQTYGKSAYMLVYERKSKKNIHEVEHNEKGEETIKELNFRSIPKFVPDWIMQEVTDDNKNFQIDAQMFHDHFFSHVKSLLKQIGNELKENSPKYVEADLAKQTKMKQVALQVAGKVLFDMQCYYEHNIQISDIGTGIEELMDYCDSPQLLENGEWSLLAEFINQFLLKDDCQHFFKILFTCTSISSRKYASVVAAKAISRMIRVYNDCKPELRETVPAIKELKQSFSKVIDLAMMALMDKECQRNAIKLEHFFKFLCIIAQSSISAAQFFLERSDAISDLIDFMLGNSSPRVTEKTEKRVAMGGAVPPPFQPLFTMVASLIRMTHTEHMSLDSRLPTHIDIKPEGEYESHKTFQLSEEAITMITGTDWVEKVIFDQKYTVAQNEEFCKAMGHLCYKNLEFSKQIIGKILKSMSFASDEGILALLNILEQISMVKDELQIYRLEYIFGFSFLMHTKDAAGNFIYGQQITDFRSNYDEFYLVQSTLDSRTASDGIIQLLWSCHKRFENRTMGCLELLLTLTGADDDIAEFVSKLPAYDYSMARFTDFIRPYIIEKRADNEKYKTALGYKEKVTLYDEITKMLDKYELFLANQLKKSGIEQPSTEYIQCPRQPIAILGMEEPSQEDQVIVLTQTIDDVVELKVVQVGAYWTESKPRGKGLGNINIPVSKSGEVVNADGGDNAQKEAQIDDPNVKAQYASMQESLGMSKEDPLQNSAAENPQDKKAETIVDSVVDANPVVGRVAAPSIQEKYPESKLCKDMLYRFMLTNLTEKNLKVSVEFKAKNQGDGQKINLAYPVGGLVDFLKPNLTGTLITLFKIDPTGNPVNFDNLEIKITQSAHPDNDFQMNTFSSQTDIPSSVKSKTQTASNSQPGSSNPQKKTGDVGVGDDVPIAAGVQTSGYLLQANPDDMPSFEGQKSCEVCTFLNAAENIVCEMCNTAF